MSKHPKNQRVAAEKKGRHAEWVAAGYLRLKAFSILDNRYKTYSGELDIVARRGKLIVFCEVKQRKNVEDGIFAVHPAAQSRLFNAAQLWIAAHPQFQRYEMRFDVIAFGEYLWPHHIKNAFEQLG